MNNLEKLRKRQSRFLSLVLRHEPQAIGISLDEAGWVDVNELLVALTNHGQELSLDQLLEIVKTNDKQRFEFNEDVSRIRATQGHSVEVELGYEPVDSLDVPEILLHGTPITAIPAIRSTGLSKMSRHHVHLHQDDAIAQAVGDRRGKSVILKIHAQAMARAGMSFFVTSNRVWLTDHVPTQYIEFPEG